MIYLGIIALIAIFGYLCFVAGHSAAWSRWTTWTRKNGYEEIENYID